MTPTTFVGNDVVDLDAPRMRGKAEDARFVARILDDVELAAVRAAEDADRELWKLWACKEAAFKTATKVRGSPPTFAHAAFGVRLDEPTPESAQRTGHVEYQELELPVMVVERRDVLHAVAYAHPRTLPLREEIGLGLALLDEPSAPWKAPLEELVHRLSRREAEPVHSRESAAVRLAARAALADAMHVAEERLEIVCEPGSPGRRPPAVLLDGAPTTADVSLSHHGRWIAWALHVEPERGRPRNPAAR